MSGSLSPSVSPAELSRKATSDWSLDPSESSNLAPELVRAVRLDLCLAGWGRHFQTSGGVAKGQGDEFELSQATDRIDDFISHDWQTSRFDKFLALIWTFNSRAALVSTTLVSCLAGVVRIYTDALWGEHWWPVFFGYLAFALTMCFWQRMRSCFCSTRRVFLDRLCICQEDDLLKRQGILSLPSFLHRAQRLTILWSSHWSSRLWCVFELATFLSRDSPQSEPHLSKEGKAIKLIPVKMGSVLLLQSLCWVALAITHAAMLDLLSPEFSQEGDDIPRVRQRLFEFYLVTFSIFAILVTLILPSFIYMGQGIIRELAELPAQLRNFRVQDVKCFCCTNDHCDPQTGESLPCDRALVHRMLARWFSTSEDDSTYLDRFNEIVRNELSIVVLSAGGNTLRFRDAFCACWSCNIPWISDFIPWWAKSELTGFTWFRWFLRGFLLWSFNMIVMLIMMRFCVILWKLSLSWLERVPRILLVVAQVFAMLGVAIFVWLPFRWWYVTTAELSLLPALPYSAAATLAIILFQCQRYDVIAVPSPVAQQESEHLANSKELAPEVSPASRLNREDVLTETFSQQEEVMMEIF